MRQPMPQRELWTIGHSTLPLPRFTAVLKTHRIGLLVDIRTVPRSRTNPQYNLETLPAALAKLGIEHLYLKELGGLRRPRPDSHNTGWKNSSFRGYADFMETEEFQAGLQKLMAAAQQRRAAIMCAEAVPWRCHRSLVADALLARHWTVWHLFVSAKESDLAGSARPARLTPFARVEGERISYPGALNEPSRIDS